MFPSDSPNPCTEIFHPQLLVQPPLLLNSPTLLVLLSLHPNASVISGLHELLLALLLQICLVEHVVGDVDQGERRDFLQRMTRADLAMCSEGR
jgi:hypothetical protein